MAFSTETNFNSRCATDAPGRSCLLLRRAQFEHKTRLGQQFLPLSVLIADKDGRRGSSGCSWRHNSTTMVLYRLGRRLASPRGSPAVDMLGRREPGRSRQPERTLWLVAEDNPR